MSTDTFAGLAAFIGEWMTMCQEELLRYADCLERIEAKQKLSITKLELLRQRIKQLEGGEKDDTSKD